MVKKIIANVDFLGYKKGDVILEKDYFPNWEPHVTITDESFNKELDLNNDGKIDEKDKSIANKVIGVLKNSKKRGN